MHPRVKDLSRQTFGMLLVIGPVPRPADKKGRGQYWDCICECLGSVVVRSDSLLQGKSTSCGCKSPRSTHARSFIQPRAKSTVSAHPEQECAKSNLVSHTHMSETTTPFSHTVTLEELIAQRDKLREFNTNSRGTREAIRWLDVQIDIASRAAHPGAYAAPQTIADAIDARHANEQDKPRTVKGETLSAQAARLQIGMQTLPEDNGIRAWVNHYLGAANSYEATDGAKQCRGDNCTSDSVSPHSTECIAQHDATVNGVTRLKFKPVLNNLSERKHSHYFKKCPYDTVDVYRILSLFAITDQALGHAIKKLLVAGGRGAGKDIGTDIKEAIDTLQRWQEMREEDVTAGLAMLDLVKA